VLPPRERPTVSHALQIAQHGRIAAAVALVVQLAVQATAIPAAGVPALEDVGSPGVEQAAPGIAAALALREGLALEPAVGRPPTDAELAGDRLAGPALPEQGPSLLMQREPLPATLGGACRDPGRRRGWRHANHLARSLRPPERAEILGVRREQRLQRLGEVVQEVEAVRHLGGLGHATPCAVDVGAGAVARDDLHAGVGLPPCRQRIRLAPGQEGQWPGYDGIWVTA
jgi:hypothetical protein